MNVIITMSVQLTISSPFVLGNNCADNVDGYRHLYRNHTSTSIAITRANNDDAVSQSIEKEEILEIEIFAALAESERTLQVILVMSYPIPYDFNNSTTRMIVKCGLLESLVSKHPGISLKISATLNLRNPGSNHDLISLPFPYNNLLPSSKSDYYRPVDLTIFGLTTESTYFVTEDPATFFKFNVYQNLNQISVLDFTLTLSLSEEEIASSLVKANRAISPAFTKKILHRAQHTDVTIVAHDGTEFNCHKCFLTAQSDVFEAMLKQSSEGLQEAKSNRIEIPDMSKDGIQALLNFIYAFDIDSVRENAEIALELLQAGHKYNIGELEDSIKQLILTWPEKMLEVDSKIEVSLGLFAFVRNVDDMEELKIRAFQVLRKRGKELLSCEYYKELFKKDITAAMELCALAIIN